MEKLIAAIIRVANGMPIETIRNENLAGSWLTWDAQPFNDFQGYDMSKRLTVARDVSHVKLMGGVGMRAVKTSVLNVAHGDYFEIVAGDKHAMSIRKNGHLTVARLN